MIRRRQPSLIRTHRPGPRPEPLEPRVVFAAGDPDPTFGGHDGVVVQDVIPYVNADFSRNDYKHGLGAESLYDVADLPDGRLLAVGGGDGAFIVVRYNPDGSPDTTFGGGDGIVQTVLDANTLKSTARAVAVLGDGKFLVAGTADRERFALAKYNADGSLDTTFAAGGADGDGVVTSDFGPRLDVATSIAVETSGKILLGGTVHEDADPNTIDSRRNIDFGLARYNADGTPDATFGPGGDDGDGLVTHDVGGGQDFLNDLLVLPDGKSLAAGSTSVGFEPGGATVVRYHPDGSLDTTFAPGGDDGDGVASLVDEAAERAGARSVSLGPDGKIVLAGSASHTEYFGRGGSWTTWFFSVARLNPNGTADTSFGGGDGVAISPSHGSAGAVAPLPGGKFLVAVEGGAPETGGTDGLAKTIRRFNADGSADASFGPGGDDGDGAVMSGLYGSQAVHVVNALHALPDGRALVVGAANAMEELEQNRGPADHLAVARLLPDGSPDTTFGAGDGQAHLRRDFVPPPGARAEGASMLVLPDGSVLVSGMHRGPDTTEFVLAKYRPDGTLDPSFSPGGADGDGVFRDAAYPGGGGVLAPAPDGQFVVAAGGPNLTTSILRFLPDGTPDPTFGLLGAAVVQPAGVAGVGEVAVDGSGRVVAVGSIDTAPGAMINSGDLAVWRFNADGTADTTFGTGGVARTQFGAAWQEGNTVQLLPDGRILAGGFAQRGGGGIAFALARFNTDGSLDPSFGPGGDEGDGRVLTSFADVPGSITDLTAMPNGQFVAVGSWFNDLLIARYHADGSLDETFGRGGADGDGRVTTNLYTDAFGNPSGDAAGGVVVLPDGRLLVAGTSHPRPEPPRSYLYLRVPFVARYNRDGTLDTTFGRAGTGAFIFNASDTGTPGVHDIALQPGTGRVLIGGAGDELSVVALDPETARTGPAANGAPTATLVAPPVVRAGDPNVTFSIRYDDDVAMNLSSIDMIDVRVTGPGGFSSTAQFVEVPSTAAATRSVLVTYRVAAPGGAFTAADNGQYAISIEPNQVFDDAGTAVAGGPLANGAFTLALPEAGPNLAVGRVAFAGRRLVAGRRHRGVATFVVRNTGTQRFVGPLTVLVLASTDPSGSAVVATLATATLQVSLRPGAARRYAARLGGPGDSLTAGRYHVTVSARPERAFELDLSDNSASTARPFRVTMPRPSRRRRGAPSAPPTGGISIVDQVVDQVPAPSLFSSSPVPAE